MVNSLFKLAQIDSYLINFAPNCYLQGAKIAYIVLIRK